MALLLGPAACDRLPTAVTGAPVEYRPEIAGSVDHAMCLLGYTGAPLRRLATGHQTVEADVDGRTASLVLDTGANVSVLNAADADEFGLSSGWGFGRPAIGLGGAMKASRARVDRFSIGEVRIRQQHLMTADLSQLSRLLNALSPTPVRGILGQDVMREHRAVVDVGRGMLYLRQEDSPPSPVPVSRCRPG